uniref:NAD dependent epimerase/dehydratase n=1 Tax=Macrostomum lignano TaxID=282301 RepID=A0A1I8I1Q6_9PLAT
MLLGGRCMHFSELVYRRDELPIWLEATKRGRLEKTEADRLLRGCTACLDFPAAAFYEDLMEHYPHAKVLLTMRDEYSWAASIRATIMYSIRTFETAIPRFLLRPLNMENAGLLMRINFELGMGVSPDPSTTDQELADALLRYAQQVRERVPPDRLLEFRASQGWQPLCQFLGGLDQPSEEFPRLNDTRYFRCCIHAIRVVSTVLVAAPVAVAVSAVAVGLWLLLCCIHAIRVVSTVLVAAPLAVAVSAVSVGLWLLL